MVDNQTHTDQHHQYIYEMLGAYALDAVTDEERLLVEEHLRICPICTEEFAYLQEATGTLPQVIDEVEPPAQLRNRIADIGQTPQESSRTPQAPSSPPTDIDRHRSTGSRGLLSFAPWAAAAVLLIAVVGLVAWNVQLRSDLQERPTLETVSIETTGAEGVQAELLHFTDPQVVVLDVRGLPEREDDEIYQVWLFQDDQPLPAGLFGEPADLIAISADIDQYQAVGVTIEPGPIGSPQPTSDPILVSEIT